MKFCGACGQQLDENALVCGQCGSPQKHIAATGEQSGFSFKRPGEYDGQQVPFPQDGSGLMGDQNLQMDQLQTAEIVQPQETETPEQKEIIGPKDETPSGSAGHSCTNCKGTLIFSLARGIWFCPDCGTEAPRIPPPYGDLPAEEDEIETKTKEMLADEPVPEVHAEPLAEDGSKPKKAKVKKQPKQVGGVTKTQATDGIIEVQNLLENKSKIGVFSTEADTLFESCKLSFSQNDYPAVMQLVKEIKQIMEKTELEQKSGGAGAGVQARATGGTTREQAVSALTSARNLIFEAEKMGFDITESKKIFKQAEPSYRAGDYETVTNFAHDVESSVNAVLGGKKLAVAPTFQPRYQDSGGQPGIVPAGRTAAQASGGKEMKDFMIKVLIPAGGLIALIMGLIITSIAWADNIWNPFSDTPNVWGPYNTVGVILGIVAVIVGSLFTILPFLLTKKVYVRMEPPKPLSMK